MGMEITRRLTAAGISVHALVRNCEKAAPLQKMGATLFFGDLAQPDTLFPALQEVEKVFLLSSAHPDQVSLQGNLVKAVQRSKIRHLVKLSASRPSADSVAPIKRWHYETEQQIMHSGIPYTFLRPGGFMQNLLHLAPLIRDKGKFFLPVGEAKVAQIDIRDIAAVALAVLLEEGHEGNAYELTGPAALSYTEIAEKLSSVMGRKIHYETISFEAAYQSILSAGHPRWYAEMLIGIYKFIVSGAMAEVTEKVALLTGNAPLSFDQFAQDHITWFQ